MIIAVIHWPLVINRMCVRCFKNWTLLIAVNFGKALKAFETQTSLLVSIAQRRSALCLAQCSRLKCHFLVLPFWNRHCLVICPQDEIPRLFIYFPLHGIQNYESLILLISLAPLVTENWHLWLVVDRLVSRVCGFLVLVWAFSCFHWWLLPRYEEALHQLCALAFPNCLHASLSTLKLQDPALGPLVCAALESLLAWIGSLSCLRWSNGVDRLSELFLLTLEYAASSLSLSRILCTGHNRVFMHIASYDPINIGPAFNI